ARSDRRKSRMFFGLWGSHAGIPQGLANATSGDLAPKWLDPRQDRMRVGCTLQNRVEAGVFPTPQQSRGEGALGAASPASISPSLTGNGRDAIFMDCDVVEIAQAILHAFQSREEFLPTFRRLLAREDCGEELRCVSHLLGLNAQLMT